MIICLSEFEILKKFKHSYPLINYSEKNLSSLFVIVENPRTTFPFSQSVCRSRFKGISKGRSIQAPHLSTDLSLNDPDTSVLPLQTDHSYLFLPPQCEDPPASDVLCLSSFLFTWLSEYPYPSLTFPVLPNMYTWLPAPGVSLLTCLPLPLTCVFPYLFYLS